MNLFEGLTAKQIGALRHTKHYIELAKNQHVFCEGHPAYSLYIVLSGEIEIYKPTLNGNVRLAVLGPNSVFGEMGLLMDTKARTASARALEPSLLLELPRNPAEMFEEIGETKAAMGFLQNFICLLGERLAQKDSPESVAVKSDVQVIEGYESDPRKALEKIERLLPKKGVFRKLVEKAKLEPGEYLFREGEAPDGFYFIHSGELEVEQRKSKGRRVQSSPSIAGEVGFFADKKRSASLKARREVVYSHFRGEDFHKLKEKKPKEALQVLWGAAQLATMLVVQRESL